MNITKAAAALGKRGGQTTGPTKARTSEQASRAASIRWQKTAFIASFAQLPPEAKAEQFARHGLTGANQTALHLWVHVQAAAK